MMTSVGSVEICKFVLFYLCIAGTVMASKRRENCYDNNLDSDFSIINYWPSTTMEVEYLLSKPEQLWPKPSEPIMNLLAYGENFSSHTYHLAPKYYCRCSLVGVDFGKDMLFHNDLGVCHVKAEFKVVEGHSVYVQAASILRDEPLWGSPNRYWDGFSFFPLLSACMNHNGWRKIPRCSPVHGFLEIDEWRFIVKHPGLNVEEKDGKIEVLFPPQNK